MEQQTLSEDLETTHSVVNYLHACYQGAFASLNMLAQLAYHEFNPEEISRTQTVLTGIQKWRGLLWQGVPVLTRTRRNAQTPEAREVLGLCGKLRHELITMVHKVERIVSDQNFPSREDDVRFLIGAYCRFAYTKDHFVRGFIEFGNTFTIPEMSETYAALLPDSEHLIDTAHMFFDIYTQAESLDAVFYQGLLEEGYFLPGVLRTYIHDLSRFMAMYTDGLTWEQAEIAPQLAHEWHMMGVSPVEAGYFNAFALSASEAANWGSIGVGDPRTIFFWRLCSFQPQTAAPWIEAGFPPPLAKEWAQARYTPQEAFDALERGITSPAELEKVPS